MAFTIHDPETDRLARELAAVTGKTVTAAIRDAVDRELAELRADAQARGSAIDGDDDHAAAVAATTARLLEIGRACAALPVFDPRAPEDILGYDGAGLPR